MQPEDCCAPYFEYHPSQRCSESEGNEEAPKDFNLEDPLELGREVNCFLWGPIKSSEEQNTKIPSPKPLIEELGDLEIPDVLNTWLVVGASDGSWSG